jgi:hypothetical protein
LPSPGPPFPAPGFTVPTEQRRWRDQESSPAFPREQPAERSQEGAVNGPVPDAMVKLALQHPDLVAEDDQLDILVGLAASGRHDERQNTAQPNVQEREGHRSMMTGICANCHFTALIEIVAPFTSPTSAFLSRRRLSAGSRAWSTRKVRRAHDQVVHPQLLVITRSLPP